MGLCSSKVPVEEKHIHDDLQIPFEEIASATDNFADKNLIYEGSSVKVYKGKLLGSGPLGNIVVQWKIERPEHQQAEDYNGWKHVIDTCRYRKKPSIVGFCGDKDIIVYDHVGNESLTKDVSDPTLSWIQRLQTCNSILKQIARAPKKLELPFFFPHYDSDLEKVYIICSGDFMFEVLCEKRSEEHPAILAIEHYENGDLEKVVHPHLLPKMRHKSFTAFSILASHCLARESTYTLDSVRKDFSSAWNIQRQSEPILDRSKIKLEDIISSTNGFAKECIIGSGTYSTVYKAELDHFDRKSGSVIRDTVAIKCMSKRVGGQDDHLFFTEVNMFFDCGHCNIVPLLGYCHEGFKRILVYKYSQSLDEYLRNTGNKIILTWAQRIQICLDIAHGLNYLHNYKDDKFRIIHGNIKSANILLGENSNAMIADFGFSKYYHWNYKTIITMNRKIIADTSKYLDPEYERTGELKSESDIYSFGVILFEILSGKLAYDPIYLAENDKGLAPIAQRRFREGTINEMVDPNIKKEVDELNYILYYGAIHYSLDTFSKIAYQCLAETPHERPTIRHIIKELHNASNFQGKLEPFKIQLSTITEATNNFSQEHWIGSGTYGTVYKAELDYFDRKSLLVKRGIVAIKDLHESEDGTRDRGFFQELNMLGGCEHPNIISLLGFYDGSSKKILVYEYAFKESLAQHLESTDRESILTWTQRLRICLGIANGLNYLHNNTEGKPRIIHRDIKSDNILLDEKWDTKIADFGLSKVHPPSQESSVIMTNNIAGTSVYLDPEYKRTGQLRRESDIYSFGVVLFEVLSGRLAYDETYLEENGNGIAPIVRQHYNEGRLKDMVDPRMKEASDYGPNQDSLDIFSKIGYQCLAKSHDERPKIEEIIKELQRALNSQLQYTSTGGRVSSSTKGRCSSSGVKIGDQHVDLNEDIITFAQARLDDILLGLGTGHDVEGVEGVSNGVKIGDQHVDLNEDTITFAQERLDDILLGLGTGHDVEGVQCLMDVYKQTMLDKSSPGPSTHSPMDPQQWKQSVEIQKTPNLFVFDATQGSKFAQMGSSAGCSTEKSYDDLALEVQELRDKIGKMEHYQTKLEAQLEAERAKTKKVELESKAQLEADRVKFEKVERESKAQLEAERAQTAELEEMIVDMKARQAEREYSLIARRDTTLVQPCAL